MNKTYRSVWNESTGTWVAVQENAASRGKKSSSVKSSSGVLLALGLSTVSVGAFAQSVGNGSIQLCTSGSTAGKSMGYGGDGTLNCVTSANFGVPSFSLNNAGDANGGNGLAMSTARVTGYRNGTLEILGQNGIVLENTASMTGHKITSLANGDVSAQSTDAVNGSQLYAIQQSTTGAVNAVLYDSSAHNSVTLGGSGHAAVKLSNVAAGVASTDAVNVSQMNDAVINNNPYISGKGASPDLSNAAKATSNGAVALGINSVADESYTVSVGNSAANVTRRITNVQSGRDDNDAVNVGQMNTAVKNVTSSTQQALAQQSSDTKIALQAISNRVGAVSATADTALGAIQSTDPYVQVDGSGGSASYAYAGVNTQSIAIGQSATATVAGGIAVGQEATATGTGTVALGQGAIAAKSGALAIGGAKATDQEAVAVGDGASASSFAAFAMGFDAKASGSSGVAVGSYSSAGGSSAVAIGSYAKATVNNTVAIGSLANVTATNAVALGANSVADRTNSVSVGATGAQRQIINVASGTSATDAVNVSQLTSAVSVFGSGASVGADGSIVNPSYVIAKQTYSNVGDAINALVTTGSTDQLAVHYDNSAATSVTLGGSTHTPVALTNVANGALSTSSLDAVNGQQLFATNTAVTTLQGDVTNIKGNITKLQGQIADAVIYDTSAHNSVTLGGSGHAAVKLTNVANGGLTVSSLDAVNGSQLYALGAKTDASGNITNAFVAYDDTSKSAITLGGSSHAAVKLTNVANGTLSTSSVDAVNGQQLFATNTAVTTLQGDVTNIKGNITKLQGQIADAVIYDTSAHNSVTLGGSGHAAVKLTNVANGGLTVSSLDAVNGSQLYALGAKTDASGNITNAFVAYDDTSKSAITLGGSGHAAVKLTNVANGTLSTSSLDAVNGQQLFATNTAVTTLQGDVTNIKGNITKLQGQIADAVIYDTSAHNSVTLGGSGHAAVKLANVANGGLTVSSLDAVNGSQLYALGAKTDASGNITNAFVAYDDTSKSAITLGGSGHAAVKLTNVANGTLSTSSLDAVNGQQLFATNTAVTTLQGDVTNIKGNITKLQGQIADAVIYDTSAHNSVTLGGSGHAAVKLTNVANGGLTVSSLDAVNGSQLYALGAKTDASGNITNAFVAYDDTSKSAITLGGSGHAAVKLTNVANGALSTSSVDAVNGQQLFATNTAVTTLQGDVTNIKGNITKLQGQIADAVIYDTSAHNSVTLGGSGHAAVKLTNVANGGLTVSSLDAVNGSQLYALGAKTDASGNITNAFVAYDDTSKNSITLGGSGHAAVKLSNVAAGVASTDAVNVAQMNDAVINNNPYISGKGAAQDLSNAAKATNGGAVALGINSVADQSYTVSVGNSATNVTRRITNVQSGRDDNDAVNVRQMNDAVSNVSSTTQQALLQQSSSTQQALQAMSTRLGAVSAAVGAVHGTDPYVQVDGDGDSSSYAYAGLNSQAIAIGQGATATVAGGIAVGLESTATGTGTVALGQGATAAKSGALAIGGAKATDQEAVAVGDGASATSFAAFAMGFDARALNSSAVALGSYSTASGTSAVAIGSFAKATVNNTVAIGSLASVTATNAVALGANSVADRMNSVSVGSTGAQRQIINVASGTSATDAVNVSQLTSAVSVFGSGASVGADGSIVKPSYVINGGTYNTVADALEHVGGGGGNDPLAVHYTDSTRSKVSLGDDLSSPVLMTNVANGALTATSVDAVNGAQLYNLASSTSSAMGGGSTVNGDGSISAPTYNIGGKTYYNAGDTFTALYGDITNMSGLADAVKYDSPAHDVVTFGGSGHTAVTVTNIAAGAVNVSSLDAVNGTQLYNLANSTAAALGKTTVNADGSISKPTYVLDTNTYYSVSDALDAVNAKAASGSVDGVVYDDGSHTKLTLGGANQNKLVSLTNVANGALSVSSVDAVNGSQLYALGAKTDASGNITNAFVAYDDTSMNSVTLGGSNHAAVQVHNVAMGAVSASSTDAVNGTQLYALGARTDASGNMLNAFVSYDDTTMSSVTFGGKDHDPVVLHNVANGVASNDAVNVAQLEAMGAKIDPSGNIQNGFVAYDDSTFNTVTLGGAGHAPVTLTNVKAGRVSSTSLDAINGTQLYNLASSTADAMGGGSTVTPNGTISAPTYIVKNATYNNVGGAITNLDGRVTNIENVITTIAGNVTDIAGQVANAVQYDSSAHDKITLGGSASTAAVALTNVANGTLSADSLDAVNGSQLYATNVQVSNLNQAIQNISVSGSEYLAVNTSNGAASATGANTVALGGGATASGQGSTAIGDMSKATGANSVAIGANSVADQDNTVSVGSEGAERRITNVADGQAPTDAVNVRQMQSGLSQLQSGINSVARNAYGGIAAATALTMIPDVDQGKNIAVGVGTANYQGYQAVAMGASARITQNIKVKVGGGYSSGGGATVGGGMSYQW